MDWATRLAEALGHWRVCLLLRFPGFPALTADEPFVYFDFHFQFRVGKAVALSTGVLRPGGFGGLAGRRHSAAAPGPQDL